MFEQELEKAESETKEPVEIDPNALPEHVPYVLIGGGAATFAAIRSITARDPGCKILVLTDEEHGPYQRPPLSKELWFGNTEESSNTLAYTAWNKKVRSIYMDAEFDYAKPGELMHYEGTKVALATGCKVNRISPYEDKVVLEDGREVGFDKCLIATGGQPRKMIELESRLGGFGVGCGIDFGLQQPNQNPLPTPNFFPHSTKIKSPTTEKFRIFKNSSCKPEPSSSAKKWP